MINHGYGVVRLDALREDHLGLLFLWRNDPKIRRWTRQSDLLTWKAHQEWFERIQTDPTVRMYRIAGALIQETLGVCGFTSIDWQNRRAEFSLYISPEHQGHRLGTEALKTLLHHGFMTLGLNCIWGETFDGNPAAHLFEKIGMIKEGSRRDFYYRDGRFIDAHLYSILRRHWDSRLLDGVTEGRTSGSWQANQGDPSGSGLDRIFSGQAYP